MDSFEVVPALPTELADAGVRVARQGQGSVVPEDRKGPTRVAIAHPLVVMRGMELGERTSDVAVRLQAVAETRRYSDPA
jgi:hypothetical protein